MQWEWFIISAGKSGFKDLGKTIELNENKFNLVTALSGSGPAYFCYLIESLINSATKLGLKKEYASKMVLQTAFGTSILLAKKNITPESLRKMVTSQKGTTEATINILSKDNFQNTILKAVNAASNRAKELS